jgi:hypothetical protein
MQCLSVQQLANWSSDPHQICGRTVVGAFVDAFQNTAREQKKLLQICFVLVPFVLVPVVATAASNQRKKEEEQVYIIVNFPSFWVLWIVLIFKTNLIRDMDNGYVYVSLQALVVPSTSGDGYHLH